MADAAPSTEHRRAPLTPAGRVVCAGAIAVAASLLMPWYGIPFSHGLSVTGFDSFGAAHVALLITVAAAVYLVMREAAGLTLPRPLRGADLIVVAGGWAALLTGFLMLDRPDELAGTTDVGLRYGVYVCLGGCAAIAIGGMRMRVEHHPR